MKVAALFDGWFRPSKAEERAAFFSVVHDREVVEHTCQYGVVFGSGMRQSVPLTVHTVKFSGEPVPSFEAPGKWCQRVDGNTLVFTT